MLAPGMSFQSNRVKVTTGAAIVPDYINQGYGFMNNGSLAIDTAVPTGNNYVGGIRVNANGAIYGTTIARG